MEASMKGSYEDFKKKVDRLVDIDLNAYKEGQMKRRISSLIKRNGYDSFESYFDAISKDRELLDEFVNYLTINVSEFYRNKSQWDVLKEHIIPELMGGSSRSLTVWSAACSTGEEPYSLVMALSNFFPLSQIRILATDIDTGAIAKAKRGLYTRKSLENLPAEYIRKYFTEQEDGLMKISDEIKNRVDFKKSDLLKDRFPSNCDLITCRNVMIYFTDEAKNELYKKFNNALRDDGIFFVGSTEQIINPAKYGFETFKTFFYQKKENI